MITPDDIRDLKTASPDYKETEYLKYEFSALRKERQPFFLNAYDLDKIFRWKLRTQYGRQASRRRTNTDAAYRIVTEAVFRIVETDINYECVIRLRPSRNGAGDGLAEFSA